MLNKKEIEANLITIGFSAEKVKTAMEKLDDLDKFTKFMVNKYDLENEDKVNNMLDTYLKLHASKIKERISNITLDENLDEKQQTHIMLIEIQKILIPLMVDFAKLHEYDEITQLENALDYYLNELYTKIANAE